MARTGVRARRLVHGQAIVDVMPIVRRRVGRVDVERLNCVDQLQQRSTFGRPLSRNRMSPPGVPQGIVE